MKNLWHFPFKPCFSTVSSHNWFIKKSIKKSFCFYIFTSFSGKTGLVYCCLIFENGVRLIKGRRDDYDLPCSSAGSQFVCYLALKPSVLSHDVAFTWKNVFFCDKFFGVLHLNYIKFDLISVKKYISCQGSTHIR